MKTTLENILFNPLNEKVLKFLGIKTDGENVLISFEKKDFYSHEGLEDFLGIEIPIDSKYVLDNQGLFVVPSTGEITAFQFGRFETAFKVDNPEKYNQRQTKKRAFPFFKSQVTESNTQIGYFSNEHGDPETIVDVRELGEDWALSINFIGQSEELIRELLVSRMKC